MSWMNREYISNVVLTSAKYSHKHAVDDEIGNFIWWELWGIREQ